jgi:hypothetical protein
LLEATGVGDNNRPFQLIQSTAGALVFSNANRSGTSTVSTTERMRIDLDGNVGIGTSDPVAKLHVNGERARFNQTLVGISTPLQIRNSGATSNGRGGGIEFVGASNTFGRLEGFWDGTDEQMRLFSTGSTTFSTNGAERLRITSAGNVLIGTTSLGTTHAYFEANTESRSRLTLGTSSTANVSLARFRNPNGTVGDIRSSGSSTSYNTSSDYRLKEDVQPMVGASDRLMALKPVNFAWKVDGTRVDGFMAHEAQEVVPEAVTGEKDAVDKDGNPEYQGIDQSKLVPLLTAALQDALKRIEALEAQLNT